MEEIRSRANGSFEKLNKLLDPSIITINTWTPELNPSKQACLQNFFPGVLNFIAYAQKKKIVSHRTFLQIS
jgi:tRNA A37 threonylcarbamoyladenosine synthetase subunit TsaC/SUA5/YrdC